MNVLDGKTGEVFETEVNGERALFDTRNDEQRLIELTNDEIIHEVSLLSAKRTEAASNAGHFRAQVKEYDKRIESYVAQLVVRDRERYGMPPLPFTSSDDDE